MRTQPIIGSAVAGLGTTLLMEYASSWLYEREDERARSREEQLRPGMPTTVLVRKAARLLGRELEEDWATKLGTWTHYAFGAAGGPAAKLLTARGIPPLTAGVAVATGCRYSPTRASTHSWGSPRHPRPSPGKPTPAASPPTPCTASSWASCSAPEPRTESRKSLSDSHFRSLGARLGCDNGGMTETSS